MSRKHIDLIGQRFGKLLVIKRVEDYIYPSGKHATQWLCLCDCGNYTTVQADSLKRGKTTSCGCFNKEKITKHGLTHTRLHTIWMNIKARCYNPNAKNYKDYGGRGISVCKNWKDDFKSFYDWSIANGYKENLTIDRIDVNGNYEPSNCRWVNMKTQQRNRRNNKIITINGESHCMIEWCELLNLNYQKVKARINRYHWSPERAFRI